MHLTFNNVNDAFEGIVEGIFTGTIPTETRATRNGETQTLIEPITVTYLNPRQRVLFNEERDCNCFFHLFESLWMLSGRNDVESLSYYSSKISQFSDDGKTFNGAYGYRWRKAARYADDNGEAILYEEKDENGDEYDVTGEDFDQLEVLIKHLKENPLSRRAVLQMWNVEDDLLKVDSSKDVCCNLSVIFEVEAGVDYDDANGPHDVPKYLNMTVVNRSNDLIWGLLGANVVHFSTLQEYVANRLMIEVGKYNQFTSNGHVYDWNWKPELWLSKRNRTMHDKRPNSWEEEYPEITRDLVQHAPTFDRELQSITDLRIQCGIRYEEPFFQEVAKPMFASWKRYKADELSKAVATLDHCMQMDWRIAGKQWLQRRIERRNNK